MVIQEPDKEAKEIDTKEAAIGIFNCAIQAIAENNYESAMDFQFKAIAALDRFSGDPECDHLIILASLSLSDLFFQVRKHLSEVLRVLNRARTVSSQQGDERNLGLIDLHMARIYQFINKVYPALTLFESGLKAIENLDDEDIRNQSVEFFGLHNSLQGKFREAVDFFEQAMSLPVHRPGQVFNPMLPAFLGMCAALLGQFYRAVGVLDSHWRRASLQANEPVARFLRAQLGSILLMSGKKREAFSHLKAAEEESIAHNDTWSLIWAQRALAHYHFLEGRTQQSYDLLRKCQLKSSEFGVYKPYYGQPWILELIFEFHCRGYEPIPEYGFESEIEKAVNGPRAILRGAALRIKAKQAVINNEALAGIESLLKKSEALLESACAPVELGKTRIDMARIMLHQGHQEEARELALKAWEGLPGYTYELFPNELRLLIQVKTSPAKHQIQGSEMLKRYFEIIEEFIPSPDPEVLLSRLIIVTSRFFEAERGAIFWFDKEKTGDEPSLRVGYNIVEEEVRHPAFRPSLKHIVETFKTDQPLIVHLPQSNYGMVVQHARTALCLPFNLKDRASGVLYYENTYSKGAFEFLDTSMLLGFTQGLSNYILRILEYCGNLEDKTLSSIRDSTVNHEYHADEIIAQSSIMLDLLAKADRAAESAAPVLILGETGVGKGLLAQHIHNKSSRRMMPFMSVNLAGIPESLIESELFGHEKGAFTGAVRQKMGRMELANKGTLFIDEIGDTPKSVQVKILQAIEEKTFFRVGGTRSLKSDFRLIAATHRDLIKEVENGHFREDLFYRLNVVPLTLPPLRERKDGILLLAKYYLARYAQKYERPFPELTSQDEEMFKGYHWPGNIRELKNVVEQALILSPGQKLIFSIPNSPRQETKVLKPSIDRFSDLPSMDEMQRRYLKYVHEKTKGKVGGPGNMADSLGMKRTTLQSRMKKLGI